MSCSKLFRVKSGKMFIFNMTRGRAGSNIDIENLRETFGRLNFEVETFENFAEEKIKKKMEEIKNQDFSRYDSVAIVFGSHGDEDSIGQTDDNQEIYIKRTFLVPMFKNKTLYGKFKWLITQTCRGHSVLEPESFIKKTVETEGEPLIDPNYYLISYASSEGFIAIRDLETGSFFIQSLCQELDALKCNEDIISILPRVSERVKNLSMSIGKIQKPTNEENFGEISVEIVVQRC